MENIKPVVYVDEDDYYCDYLDFIHRNPLEDEIFDRYCLDFYDLNYDWQDVYEFVCDFNLELMESLGEIMAYFKSNMSNITPEVEEALIDMCFDIEEIKDDMQYKETARMEFEQVIKDINKIDDEDTQEYILELIFGESIHNIGIEKLHKLLIEDC